MSLTINSPFSDGPHDTLIVCRDLRHMLSVQRALKFDAQYTTYSSSLMGARFDQIIVFSSCDHGSKVVREMSEIYINEYLRTKLCPGGELHEV